MKIQERDPYLVPKLVDNMKWAIVFNYYDTKEEAEKQANKLEKETGYDFEVIAIPYKMYMLWKSFLEEKAEKH